MSKKTQLSKRKRTEEKIVIRPKGITTFKIPESLLDQKLNKDIILFENKTNGVSQKIIKSAEGELTFVSKTDSRVVERVKNVSELTEKSEVKIKGISLFKVGLAVFVLLVVAFVIFLIKKKFYYVFRR